jgi:Cellulose biosynthesis protein BcsS
VLRQVTGGWRCRARLNKSRLNKSLWGAFLSLASALTLCNPTHAEAGSEARPLSREVWAGADVSNGKASSSWLIYSGATSAPFGGIYENGLRLRATIGYGQYSYTHLKNQTSKKPEVTTFDATTAFADVLVGYLYRYNSLTAKAFVGVSFIDHDIAPFDTGNISINSAVGAKGVLEFWYNSSPKAWSSLDLAYSTAHATASVRMRSGYRLWPQVSIGVEGGLNIDGQAQCKIRLSTQKGCPFSKDDTDAASLLDFGRTGLFARYEWTGGEVSVSAGGLGQIIAADGSFNLDPYVTVNWVMQF